MKFAIIGYGKMGHIIEEVIRERGHEVSVIIDAHNQDAFDTPSFLESDAAIEFTTPSTAFDNVCRCLERGVPVVCGSTGWTDRLPEAEEMCRRMNGAMMFASNYSIGVNIFMALSRYLTKVMNNFPEYHPGMVEVHHVHKLDHPSGTAVTLADQLIEQSSRITEWAEPKAGVTPPDTTLVVDHERRGEVPGIHTVVWNSQADEISITHSAHSRRGFAQGAVMAAEWLPAHKGVQSISAMMADITATNGIF